ncbi:prolyl oligopeptidase family serine peptidase [Sporocytophaga myxococcoides]|uniref:prolyl oligopeptidase family serine peptidase n=1 Tax=Sporocytophaga myxococcoides TaxID=153721 RepID=UPI0003F8E746|nr:prolyl oligopeptidase family serine peptidase [Sporocytophaga myxococcoides]
MKKLILLAFLFFNLDCYGQQYSQKWSDINYAGDGKGYHNLDIYLPKTVKDKYPVVVYIYGSAWYSNNSKGADMNTIGAALLDAGFAVVTPNHRSSSDAKFPAQINDIKAVIRFIRGKSTEFKFDTTFIGISGSSSGGHLASLAGTTNNIIDYTVGAVTMNIEGTLGNYTQYNSSVDAVCDWFGPIDFFKMEGCNTYKSGNSPESDIIGGPLPSNLDKLALLGPITYVDPTDPPFLIFHGDKDNVVPYCQGQFLNTALTKAGVESEFVLVPNGQHGPGVNDVQANLQRMVTFFLKTKTAVVTSIKEQADNPGTTIMLSENSIDISNLSIGKIEKYELTDMSGKMILSGISNENQIYFSGLNNGIYILSLYTSGGKKLVQRIASSR